MKCIKNVHTEEIRRVRNSQAKDYVKLGDWNYIPKEEWKAARTKAAEQKAAEKKAKEEATKKKTTKSANASKGNKKHQQK